MPDTQRFIHGECLEVMRGMEANSVDAVVTDPPYGLGFMGKAWDHGVPGPAFFEEMLRVSKPGAPLFAFGGTRLYHRMTCSIEDAGWEIRDCLMWLYGSGFPKSLDVSKAIDKAAGHWRGKCGEVTISHQHSKGTEYVRTDKGEPISDSAHKFNGYGTALKPAWEPIVLAMKPTDGTFAQNAQRWGVAGLNIEGGRLATTAASFQDGRADKVQQNAYGKYGTADYDGSKGRWPANVVLDEEAAMMLDAEGPQSTSRIGLPRSSATPGDGWGMTATGGEYSDTGGPSRFFYTSKAGSEERVGENTHPTVKPTDLMRWLVRLAKSSGDCTILDPFMGSGSTGVACYLERCSFIGIERELEYVEIAKRRLQAERDAIGLFSMVGKD